MKSPNQFETRKRSQDIKAMLDKQLERKKTSKFVSPVLSVGQPPKPAFEFVKDRQSVETDLRVKELI